MENGATYNGAVGGSKSSADDQLGAMEAEKKANKAENIAKMVFTFISGAKAFAEGLDAGEEMKLLRMRTKRNEIVIVPGNCLLYTPFETCQD